MLIAKIRMIQWYVLKSTPFIFIILFFILGNLFSKFLVRYKEKKIAKKLKFFCVICLAASFLVSFIRFEGLYPLAAFAGLLSRVVIEKLSRKSAKGSIHEKSQEFYLGTSRPLHKGYYYGLENNVVKSALLTHHQLIYGASGSGKTYSTLQPQCYFDIKWGRRLFVIDPKGDLDFCNHVFSSSKLFKVV